MTIFRGSVNVLINKYIQNQTYLISVRTVKHQHRIYLANMIYNVDKKKSF